jgi:dihydrofolate synthase/folylpolyglutamate synthase
MHRANTPYQQAIAYLYDLQKYGIKFGLSKTTNLLEAFGNPQEGQKYIHIGGTNGKGSVGAMLASILMEAGFKVGFYSSPHLVRFTERFRINDREIATDKAAQLVEELKRSVVPDEPPTFFEAVTAMALSHFAREKTDIAIMEVGMGGRLDATNVIKPLVSVITNISMEHQEFLGSRLLEIAAEKAGIIKEGVDIITAETRPEVIGFFEKTCQERKTRLWRVGKDIRYRVTGSGMHYYGLEQRLRSLEIGLAGQYQGRNAALSLAVIEFLKKQGLGVSEDHVRQGLKAAVWPGRMHVMPGHPTVLLDGAHNPAAVRALAASIKADFDYRRLLLVIGVMADKELGTILDGIVPLADYVIYTRPVYYRAAEPEVLASEAGRFGKPGETALLLTEALDRARGMAGPGDLIVVCGSLFTVGEALSYLDPVKFAPDELPTHDR